MNLFTTVKQIYPHFTYEDFEVFNDGNGEYIKWHNKDVAKPTQKALDEAWLQVEAQAAEDNVKNIKREQILQIASNTDQINAISDVLYILTKDSTDPYIVAVRAKWDEIKNILKD